MFGRRRASEPRPDLDRVVDLVERGKADLVRAVPSPRGVPGRPVAEAVAAFEEGLTGAAGELDRWTGDHHVRRSCRRGIEEALARAERLRLEAPELDYEGLVAALADLLEPLEVFADADRSPRT